MFELPAELAALFIELHFLLKEQLKKKPWLVRLGYLADNFSEMHEVDLIVQGKQLTIFTVKNLNIPGKITFLENLFVPQ